MLSCASPDCIRPAGSAARRTFLRLVGAVLGISLIHAALHVLNDMKTFGEVAVSVAEDGPGALVQDPSVKD